MEGTRPLPPGQAAILVVDDAPGQRLAIEAALAELGETVVSVASGGEALRFLLDGDAAVILLDVNMPEMDGFETASLIRQRPRSSHTPIIFLTANTDEVAAARAYSLGAVDYIFSPFSAEVLRAKVRVFVELAKAQERQRREAEHRIALSREQAARAAAEEESRRLRVLADASGVLTRSLDTATLVADLLALFVPRMADVAAVTLVDEAGREAETSWLEGAGAPRVGRLETLATAAPALAASLERSLGARAIDAPAAPDGPGAVGVAVPLIASGRSFGAVGVAFTWSPRRYGDADVHLVSDIAGRAAIALDNSRLYQAINERDRLKDEFLAMLSHELRNPLGAIRSAVHVLDAEESLAEPGRRARGVIGRQADHLARMVDDLLEVARLTSGRIAMAHVPVELTAVVQQALDTLRVAGHSDHHTLKTRLEPVTVLGDATRIEQIVSNLLVNALKYTNRGGQIDVEVGAEGTEAVLRVRDTGIGISAEMLPRLFELFSQGRQALDRSKGGLGIGLTLVRRLAELHGGRVEAASEGPGRGSEFTVRLPRTAAVPAPEGARPAPPVPAAAPLRVLVVEDNDDARDMLRTVLRLAGHEVHEAADGVAALHVAADVRPHVALIDLGLPGLDGLEVAARLRARADADPPLLVAVTGYGQQADRQRTKQAGFDLHLTKPVDPDRLTEVVAEAARRWLARAET